MKLTLLLAGAVAAALCSESGSDSELQTGAKTHQVRYAYTEPTNPAHRGIYDRLRAMRVLERLSEYLSPLELPRPLTLKVQGCDGRMNAYYWDDVVMVCYEYFDFLLKVAPQMPTPEGLTRHQALAGMTADVFLHETGHAVFDMLGIPFLGREEDAADQFSALAILRMSMDDSRRLFLGVAYLGSKEAQQEMAKPFVQTDFADVHELPAQRYFNMLCMAYGADQNLFADAVTSWHLPEQRAKNCHYEYRRFEYAFHILIDPHIDQTLVKEVRAQKLLAFPELQTVSWDP
jgi:hypothetical protein